MVGISASSDGVVVSKANNEMQLQLDDSPTTVTFSPNEQPQDGWLLTPQYHLGVQNRDESGLDAEVIYDGSYEMELKPYQKIPVQKEPAGQAVVLLSAAAGQSQFARSDNTRSRQLLEVHQKTEVEYDGSYEMELDSLESSLK